MSSFETNPISTPTTIDRRNFLAFLSVAAGAAVFSSPAMGRLISTTSAAPILAWDTIHKAGFHVMADLNTGGNSLVMTAGEQALLIDTKFAHLGGSLYSDAKTFAAPQGDFDLTLINTHHHGDHTGGNGMIVPYATSYAHKKAVKRIKTQLDTYIEAAKSGPAQIKRNKGSDEQLTQAIAAANASKAWTRADVAPKNRVPDEGMTITIGDRKVAMHHFGRGHTDNDLIVHFEQYNIIHTGDLVFAGLHPFFDPSARASAIGWTKSLKGLLELCNDETIIVPGHGPVGDIQSVKAQLNYMNNIIEHVQADIDAKVPKEETAKKTWDFMKGLGFEGIRERAINAVYDELS